MVKVVENGLCKLSSNLLSTNVFDKGMNPSLLFQTGLSVRDTGRERKL